MQHQTYDAGSIPDSVLAALEVRVGSALDTVLAALGRDSVCWQLIIPSGISLHRCSLRIAASSDPERSSLTTGLVFDLNCDLEDVHIIKSRYGSREVADSMTRSWVVENCTLPFPSIASALQDGIKTYAGVLAWADGNPVGWVREWEASR